MQFRRDHAAAGGAQALSVDAAVIAHSLELAGERCPDLTPLVYAKIFAQYPDMQPLFVRDKTGQVRGEMLARVIEVVLDFIDGNHYASNLIASESITHDGYGVPRDIFPKFFDALAETVREVIGADWTQEMDESWATLRAALREASS
ncbi:MAG TPA: globin [Rhizomicrobium sp.]|nr:globin [Rhizomicrobium sp.]